MENNDIEAAIQYAKKYLEDLLSFFGLNTDVYATSEDGEVIELNIPSTHMNGFLIGQHGETTRSLQFLVSNALKNQGYACSRVNVDVAEYKKQRAERLTDTAEEWIKRVKDTGEPYELKPMNAADRRTVHRVASEAGLISESVGEGRDRRIVLVTEHTPDGIAEAFDVPYTTLKHGRHVPNVERVYQKRYSPAPEIDLLPSDGDTWGTYYKSNDGEVERLVVVFDGYDTYGPNGEPLDPRNPLAWALLEPGESEVCGCGCEQRRVTCYRCNAIVSETRIATYGRVRECCIPCADLCDDEQAARASE